MATPMRSLWSEEDCLAFGPFEGDRDVDVTPIRDGFVKTRKPTRCHVCDEEIPAGTRVRSITEAFDGQIGTWRFCPICCQAMAESWEDDGAAIDERYRVGERNRMARRNAVQPAAEAPDATAPHAAEASEVPALSPSQPKPSPEDA